MLNRLRRRLVITRHLSRRHTRVLLIPTAQSTSGAEVFRVLSVHGDILTVARTSSPQTGR